MKYADALDPLHHPVPVVVPLEEDAGEGVWRRWLALQFLWRRSFYGFTANARSLTIDAAVGATAETALRAETFAPLEPQHTVNNDPAVEPAPAVLVKSAIDACRAVALRLYQRGVNRSAIEQAWPPGRLSFAHIVTGGPESWSARHGPAASWSPPPPTSTANGRQYPMRTRRRTPSNTLIP